MDNKVTEGLLIPVNDQRIEVKDSKCFWEKHFDMDSWCLVLPYIVLGKRWGFDKVGEDTYGWISLKTFGENVGKYEASIPTFFDEESGSDSKTLGFFNNLTQAMLAILESNHPDLGGISV